MDSYENGCYTIGGDDPCPFCNTEAWLKTVLDNEKFASREEALAWVEKMREKWGAEHLADSRKMSPNDLEEAAKEFANQDCVTFISRKKGFIAGAKWQEEKDQETIKLAEDHAFLAGSDWQREQMLSEAAEGEVVKDINNKLAVTAKNVNLDKFKFGDKVRVIIVKEDEK